MSYQDKDFLAPARRMAQYIGEIISVATASPRGHRKHSAIRCRRRPGHRRCPGRIVVCERDDDYIEWECPSCADRGVIHNWQSSPWNLSRWRPQEDEANFEVVLTEQEYDELKNCLVAFSEDDRIVYGATYTGESLSCEPAAKTLTSSPDAWRSTRIVKRIGDVSGAWIAYWTASRLCSGHGARANHPRLHNHIKLNG